MKIQVQAVVLLALLIVLQAYGERADELTRKQIADQIRSSRRRGAGASNRASREAKVKEREEALKEMAREERDKAKRLAKKNVPNKGIIPNPDGEEMEAVEQAETSESFAFLFLRKRRGSSRRMRRKEDSDAGRY